MRGTFLIDQPRLAPGRQCGQPSVEANRGTLHRLPKVDARHVAAGLEREGEDHLLTGG